MIIPINATAYPTITFNPPAKTIVRMVRNGSSDTLSRFSWDVYVTDPVNGEEDLVGTIRHRVGYGFEFSDAKFYESNVGWHYAYDPDCLITIANFIKEIKKQPGVNHDCQHPE